MVDYSLDDSGTPPPQPRELKSNLSINHYNETFTVIGLNISWIDEGMDGVCDRFYHFNFLILILLIL